MKKFKQIPKFKNEDQERNFWANHDSTQYIDWSKADKAIFPNLKPATVSISSRLPSSLLNRIKQLANQINISFFIFSIACLCSFTSKNFLTGSNFSINQSASPFLRSSGNNLLFL